jgi:hypothetical protein
MANGADIIIKGGSVDISFDNAVYPPGNSGSHSNSGARMQRILITDEQNQTKYDSGQSGAVGKWTVSVFANQPAKQAE